MPQNFREREEKDVKHDVFKGENLGDAPAGDTATNCLCSSGIHFGQYPVKGKTVGEAKKMLGSLLHIDPEAVGVINTETVDDDYVIGKDCELVTFVKEAAMKGGA